MKFMVATTYEIHGGYTHPHLILHPNTRKYASLFSCHALGFSPSKVGNPFVAATLYD